MNLKECVLENQQCRDIIVHCVDTNETKLIKDQGIWLFDPQHLLQKKVKTFTRYGNNSITIMYYK